jgi:hypothetical protein
MRDLGLKQDETYDAIEVKIKMQAEKLKQQIDYSQQALLDKMIDENRKEDTVLEGRCQQYTVAAEARIIERLNEL